MALGYLAKGIEMPLLNFYKQFKDLVKYGLKTQTIRKKRIHPIKIGDKLYLYSGLRTKDVERLGEAICIDINQIKIDYRIVFYDEVDLRYRELEEFIKKDGLNEIEDFFLWFKSHYGNYFNGVVIKWKLL